jgi:hypothetical protein
LQEVQNVMNVGFNPIANIFRKCINKKWVPFGDPFSN